LKSAGQVDLVDVGNEVGERGREQLLSPTRDFRGALMRTIRSFLALKLNLSVVERLAEAQKQLWTACRDAGMTIRWIPPPNIHMTMRFLGNVTEPMAFAVKDMLEPIITKTPVFELETMGIGAFPDTSNPRVIWAGLGQGAEVLGDLHSAIYNRLLKAGFNLDDKPFRAHVTLGRVKNGPPGAFATCLNDSIPRDFGVSTVKNLHCYESDLTPRGAEYTSVWVLPFQKGNRRSPPTRETPEVPPEVREDDKGE
jgi:RNA 2',3'-cyclic 3'-phosphodiesterase